MSTVLILFEGDGRDYASSVLAEHGCDVVSTRTLRESLNWLKENRHCDLIVAPVHLMNDDVFDFLRWVRGDNWHKEDAFLFFAVSPSDYTKAMQATIKAGAHVLGATAVLMMDFFDQAEFIAEVERLLNKQPRELIDRWQLLNLREKQQAEREAALQERERFLKRREDSASRTEEI